MYLSPSCIIKIHRQRYPLLDEQWRQRHSFRKQSTAWDFQCNTAQRFLWERRALVPLASLGLDPHLNLQKTGAHFKTSTLIFFHLYLRVKATPEFCQLRKARITLKWGHSDDFFRSVSASAPNKTGKCHVQASCGQNYIKNLLKRLCLGTIRNVT